MSISVWLKPSPTGPSKPSRGSRKRPAYKELLRNLITRPRTQDGESSLPSEEPSGGSEAHQASSEEWTRAWAADLKKVVVESTGTDSDSMILSLAFHLIG